MLKAFHNNPSLKQTYLNRIKQHQIADEIVKGFYWEEGRGCAVGCTIHSGVHKDYEKELGIPEWLARVEDTIFEGLPLNMAKGWPYRFLNSINLGADLNKIKSPFLVFVLGSTLECFDHEKFPQVKKAILNVIDMHKLGNFSDAVADADADAVADVAYVAADAAYVAYIAADAADADAVADAAYVADAVADAAYVAYVAADAAYVAYVAYIAADAAYAAYIAADAAITNRYIMFSDELIRLLKECN